ncbi:ABC transporter permease, partial [bacterium 1XD42-8]
MWIKKMKHKKLQMFLIGLLLFASALTLNMCISFTVEMIIFSQNVITEENCPDSYLITIGTNELDKLLTNVEYSNEVENSRTLSGKTITVPVKYNEKDISMYYDMLLGTDNYENFSYIQLLDNNVSVAPKDGEVWISETIAVPSGIKKGDVISVCYDTPLNLKVSGIYRSTCFPKALGYAPMLVSNNQLNEIDNETPSAFFAVNIKNYSNEKMKSLFNETSYFVLNRTRDDVKMSIIEYSGILGTIGIVATVLLFIVTMIILGYIINNNIIREYKNIGIYKSLGFTSKSIILLYLKGYLFIGAIAITLGAFLSLPFIKGMGKVSTEYIEGFSLSIATVLCSVCSILALILLLWTGLIRALLKIKSISPVEAITVGATSSKNKLSKSLLKNAKKPMSMAINEIFKYRFSNFLMIITILTCMYLAMLFGMIWYSSMTMLSNTNLWFCLPKNDVYISGNLTEEIYKYVGENEYVKSIVYGDFSYVEEIKVVGHEELVNYLRFDTYNDFSYENTGIKIIEGREPTEINEVLLGEELISLLKLNVGDTIQLKLNNVSRVYEICGSFQTVADQGLKIMMSTKTVKDIIPDYVPKRGYIQLYDMNKYELLKKQIEDKFPNIVVDKKWSAMEISIQTTQAMLNSLSMVLIVVLLVFAV